MKMAERHRKVISSIYEKLYKAFGPQYWWPAKTKFEVMLGAVLTQNTAWQNVEKSITVLRKKKLLSFQKMLNLPEKELALLIKSCGYYNIKAKRLKNLLNFIKEKGGLAVFLKSNPAVLRKELLEVNGIGMETADSILLYAGNWPFFVVDAYTRRMLWRHNLIDKKADYSAIQELFMENLTLNAPLFNEYHALIVKLGKEYCRTTPLCITCPLNGIEI